MRLTDRAVKSLPLPAKGNKLFYDDEVKGFACRVTAAGARSFVLNYHIDGRERRITIGSFPQWSVIAAREEAMRLKVETDRGRDPMALREAATMAELVESYQAHELPQLRPESQRQYRAIITELILPRLGGLKVSAVKHADVLLLHREVTKHAPYQANRTLAVLSILFNLAIRLGMRPDNPCKGVRRNQEQKRQRFLSPEEIERLTGALSAHPNQQSANIVRLLVLTGARKSEVLAMRWADLDLQGGVWTKPSAHTKQKKEHRVPLSAPALTLLSGIERAGEHVFPAENGEGHQGDIKRFWATVCKWAGLSAVRIHDLRHTYASILASSGLSLPIIGALLGHTQPGTTARYAHLYDDPLRAATERAAAIITGNGKAAVVELPRRAKP